MAKEIERLIELDEQETARQHEREASLTLTAAAFEALPDALIVIDLEGKIVLVNERAEFMFGYPRAELVGRPVEMLMPARTRQIHSQHRREYNQFNLIPHARTMGLGLQLVALRCDGVEFPTEIKLARMVAQQGIFNLAMIRSIPRGADPLAVPDAAAGTGHTIEKIDA